MTAQFYSDENLALQVIQRMRQLGHDVLTSVEAGNANRAVPDIEVLSYAAQQRRILLTYNRRHFLRLQQEGECNHAGIVLCTFDPDFAGQAQRIDQAVREAGDMTNKLLRVNRPAQ